jgi:hypothetical protein
MANKNRRKGHDYERLLVRHFKELGYTFAKTSRAASVLLDSSGIDIWGIPYAVQAKTGYKNARPKYEEIYQGIKERIQLNFPPHDEIHKSPILLFHRIGTKPEENVVMMTADYFFELISKANPQVIEEERVSAD